MIKPDGIYFEIWRKEKSVSMHLAQCFIDDFGPDFPTQLQHLIDRMTDTLEEEIEKHEQSSPTVSN